jgi:Family of unknown function (DUF5996)
VDAVDASGTGATTRWPDLTLTEWEGTRVALHLWSQVVGKVRMALEPMVNHWWQVPLYVSVRGLTTSLMHGPAGGLEAEFDFLDQVLVVRTTSGVRRTVALTDRSVADFHAETMAALASVGVEVDILARPVEVPVSIPFAEDTEVRRYDPDAARRFWLAMVEADRLFHRFRAGFRGKASPVHFFWGGFDLAVTRFSGRPAPPHPGGAPNCADWVMVEAYSHEVSSCGYWPGGSDEGSFYAYAYPEPAGFADWPLDDVPGGYYDAELGEFILPYRTVRQSPVPDTLLLTFLQRTYEAAADLGAWDRTGLEVVPAPVPARHRTG